MTECKDPRPERQRAIDRRVIRTAFIAHIRLVLERIGGGLSNAREEKMQLMRMNELVDLGANLRETTTFRDAAVMLIAAIDKSDRMRLQSN